MCDLNRQFLFKNTDIGKSKSATAAEQIHKINKEIEIIAYEHKVSKETAHIFNKSFFESITCVANALDNIEARIYMDNICIKYKQKII